MSSLVLSEHRYFTNSCKQAGERGREGEERGGERERREEERGREGEGEGREADKVDLLEYGNCNCLSK